jgi:indole-3-acetaldehyde oxidase
VLVSKYDPATDEVTEFSASSCLTLLHSVDRCSVTTSEGIGNTKDGYHPVQQRLSGFHASQCGFCTPGMCMSIFSALVKADKAANRPAPPAGFSKLTSSEAEKAVSGNLCRCTGYRPIVDACKSFAADVDLEDLGLNCFWKKGDEPADVSKLPGYNSGDVCTFPDFLKSEIKSSIQQANSAPVPVSDDGWYRPRSIDELHRLFQSSSFDENSVKIVASNTGSGVYKDQDLYDKYIDIKGIPELSVINRSSKGIELGSVVSISKAIEVLSDGNLVFRKIAGHLNKVASPFVRNTATIGGNIVMAQRLPFASDIATILLAAGSTVTIQVASKRLCFTLEEFLQQPPCDSRTLLLSIFIPEWGSNDVTFETFRAAPRPLGNAVSYVNSAFLARTSLDAASKDHLIEDICLAFGAYGADHAIRARKVEDYLKGKTVSSSVILEAVRLLKGSIKPSEGSTHPEYRISLAVSFLFTFLSSLANSLNESAKVNGTNEHSPEKQLKLDINDLPIRSRQEIFFTDAYKPVGKAIKKAGVEIQASGRQSYPNTQINMFISSPYPFSSAYSTTKSFSDPPFCHLHLNIFSAENSNKLHPLTFLAPAVSLQDNAFNNIPFTDTGEAVYVDDIPAPKDCLYGAFIYSTHPHAHVKSINFKPSLASQKIITVITAKDIPSGGQNVGYSFPMIGEEALFADPVAEFAGQNIGVVVMFPKFPFTFHKTVLKFMSIQPCCVMLVFLSLRLLKHRSMPTWRQSKPSLSIAQKICSHQF